MAAAARPQSCHRRRLPNLQSRRNHYGSQRPDHHQRTSSRMPAQGSRASGRALPHLWRPRSPHRQQSLLLLRLRQVPLPPRRQPRALYHSHPVDDPGRLHRIEWRRGHRRFNRHRRKQQTLDLRPHQQRLRRKLLHPHAVPGPEKRNPNVQRHPRQLSLSYLCQDGILHATAQQSERPHQQLPRRLSQRLRQQRAGLARRLGCQSEAPPLHRRRHGCGSLPAELHLRWHRLRRLWLAVTSLRRRHRRQHLPQVL